MMRCVWKVHNMRWRKFNEIFIFLALESDGIFQWEWISLASHDSFLSHILCYDSVFLHSSLIQIYSRFNMKVKFSISLLNLYFKIEFPFSGCKFSSCWWFHHSGFYQQDSLTRASRIIKLKGRASIMRFARRSSRKFFAVDAHRSSTAGNYGVNNPMSTMGLI